MKIVISAGHGLKVRGASGIVDEVDEARKIVTRTADFLRAAGVETIVYFDDVSTSQAENLDRICDFHNSPANSPHDWDVSVHLNAYDGSASGTEGLYVTQED